MSELQGIKEVFSYRDEIKKYLEAGAGANVADYLFATDNQAMGIKLAWECDKKAEKYVLRYGVKGCNVNEVMEVVLDSSETEYELYNLYKEIGRAHV